MTFSACGQLNGSQCPEIKFHPLQQVTCVPTPTFPLSSWLFLLSCCPQPVISKCQSFVHVESSAQHFQQALPSLQRPVYIISPHFPVLFNPSCNLTPSRINYSLVCVPWSYCSYSTGYLITNCLPVSPFKWFVLEHRGVLSQLSWHTSGILEFKKKEATKMYIIQVYCYSPRGTPAIFGQAHPNTVLLWMGRVSS